MVKSKDDYSYFKINGYNFRLSTDSSSESELNLVINRMFLPDKLWGYNDIQWTNFTGENMNLTIYSRIYDVYTGEEAQPELESVAIKDFYKTPRTPHAVLKYWSQNFVPCEVSTDLESFEGGRYIIESIKQTNLTYDFIQTDLTLKQYEKPQEQIQTYWRPQDYVLPDTSYMTAKAEEIQRLTFHTQTCDCKETTPADECTTVSNSEVRLIQTWLQKWGFFPAYTRLTGSINVNGKYCYHTTQAIKKFQETMGIPITGDFTDETKSKFLKKVVESG